MPNRKIVYDNAFETPGADKMVVTVSFDEKGGKTTLTIHTLFASVAMKDEHLGVGFDEGTAPASINSRTLSRRCTARQRR